MEHGSHPAAVIALIALLQAACPAPLAVRAIHAAGPAATPGIHDPVATGRPTVLQEGEDLACWLPDSRDVYERFEQALLGLIDAGSLRLYHDLFAAEPHPAGSDGDARMIARLEDIFDSMGLGVERHEFDALLSFPISAALEIRSPVQEPLRLIEQVLPEDPYSAHAGLGIGFNAYSGSGEIEAGVVYANLGRRQDFEALAALGVEVRGRIALIRYGGLYRGLKVHNAEAAGAAGVILYTDPAESGWTRGAPWPEGGFSNATSIQRGSVLAKAFAGDPLTPYIEASEFAPRLDPDDAGLPTIPVQPVGWDAAARIMRLMTGTPLPADLERAWKGALPVEYRLDGGEVLRVRLRVEQDRRITRTANVVARLQGQRRPDELIILGCHHDAWTFGASDPTAGLICLFEAARCLATLAERGWRPDRTVVFAAWGAEEFGIIGSTEWVEANREALIRGAVCYINLDMAAMGADPGAAASPSLVRLIRQVARTVPSAGDPTMSVLDAWTRNGSREARVGDLGGGSDHLPFVCHIGIPSAALSAGGAPGVAYHTNYDSLAWYRHVVGEDYGPARMVAGMTTATAARLACAHLLPLDPRELPLRVAAFIDACAAQAREAGLPDRDLGGLGEEVTALADAAEALWPALLALVEHSALSVDRLDDLNQQLRALDRLWFEPAGLRDRPWFRSLLVAVDPATGYGTWPLPSIREAIASGTPARLAIAVDQLRERVAAHARGLRELHTALGDTVAP